MMGQEKEVGKSWMGKSHWDNQHAFLEDLSTPEHNRGSPGTPKTKNIEIKK